MLFGLIGVTPFTFSIAWANALCSGDGALPGSNWANRPCISLMARLSGSPKPKKLPAPVRMIGSTFSGKGVLINNQRHRLAVVPRLAHPRAKSRPVLLRIASVLLLASMGFLERLLPGLKREAREFRALKISRNTVLCDLTKSLENMLEERPAFLLKKFRRINSRQSIIERILDCQTHLCAGLVFLAPIKHQYGLQPFEQLPSNFFHLIPFPTVQFWARSGQKVEDGQFVFGEVFANMARLFVGQVAAKFQQLLENDGRTAKGKELAGPEKVDVRASVQSLF